MRVIVLLLVLSVSGGCSQSGRIGANGVRDAGIDAPIIVTDASVDPMVDAAMDAPVEVDASDAFMDATTDASDATTDAATDAHMGVIAFAQNEYIKASNTEDSDIFGYHLALSVDGNTLAVGAPGDDSAGTGLTADQSNNSAHDSGAVFIFKRVGSVWTQQAYIKASNTDAEDRFGERIALSSDGATLAVGVISEASSAVGVGGNQALNDAPLSGAVYVFHYALGGWTQTAYLKASNTDAGDHFGYSLSLNPAGTLLAVGAPYESSSATGIGGNQTLNDANASGAVYVFTLADGTWSQTDYVKASNTGALDNFGWDVAFSGSGNILIVGAPHESSSASGVDGDQALNDLTNSGAAYVFFFSGAHWAQQAYVKASNPDESDAFGSSVAMASDGRTIAIGAPLESSPSREVNGDQTLNTAPGAGAVYVLVRDGTFVWIQEAYIKASNADPHDSFGSSVAFGSGGDMLLVGAPDESSAATGVDGNQGDNSAPESGAAYTYRRSGMTWSQYAYVKASNTEANDSFGQTVDTTFDASLLVIGAFAESSNATGIGGDQSNNAATSAGAVYAFDSTEF